MFFLILPNQLYDIGYLKNVGNRMIIWECPHYFTAYSYNKKKLILHRASMRAYYDMLLKKGYNVVYVEFGTKLDDNAEYLLYNPLDNPSILGLPKKHKIIDILIPNMLLNDAIFKEYREHTKNFFFNAFYMWSKKRIGIIPDIKSQDKNNRLRINNSVSIKQPYDDVAVSKPSIEYIQEASRYVLKHFKDNPGNVDRFIFPITRVDSLKWLKHFIKNKLKNFGPYQDFIDKHNNHLYHSLLSSLLNIGLIGPYDVIKMLPKSGIPINSYEGFIRQLFWREYQYYCYLYFDFSGNYFGNTKRLGKEWYTAKVGIEPVDDAILEAFDSGYLHHIKRLMVIGNYMNLCGIRPKEGFRWFMEFSCDSYEWVMHQNVYEMVFCVSGGGTMRRPYVSSSNYILHMSNYKRDKWCIEWDNKYHAFIEKNKKKLWKFRYYFRGV
jgi:deoxyribodipyrimidine photolyase-related protein